MSRPSWTPFNSKPITTRPKPPETDWAATKCIRARVDEVRRKFEEARAIKSADEWWSDL